MIDWSWLAAVVLVPLVLREAGDVAPWLAGRLVGWGARRMRTEVARRRYAEEWAANVACVPGSLTKVVYALRILAVAVPQLRRQQSRERRRIEALRGRADQAVAVLRAATGTQQTYQAVVDGVVSGLGFQSVLLNLVRPGGDVQAVAANGPAPMVNMLLGAIGRRSEVDKHLRMCDSWEGRLRFGVPNAEAAQIDLAAYIPDVPGDVDPRRWGPLHQLAVPLYGPGGELMGFLSVDEPETGQVPDMPLRGLLEAYAAEVEFALIRLRSEDTIPLPRPNP